MLLLDTSFLISYLNDDVDLTALMNSIEDEVFAISVVTFAELLIGFEFIETKKTKQQRQFFEELVEEGKLHIIPCDSHVAIEFAHLQKALLKTGNPISKFDAIIAATAITHNLELVTLDNDFKRIKKLKLYVIS